MNGMFAIHEHFPIMDSPADDLCATVCSRLSCAGHASRVTIAGHLSDDLAPGTMNSIFKQAGFKE